MLITIPSILSKDDVKQVRRRAITGGQTQSTIAVNLGHGADIGQVHLAKANQ